MKSTTLIPILLPTEDANSSLYFNPEKELCIGKHIIISGKEHPKQHIYLCSTESESSKAGEWNYDQTIKCVVNDMAHSDCFKILFTTDPRLIADGVPAIDGNTKALINPENETGFILIKQYVEVNFLEEFCKRYNQKDNEKAVDVEALAESLALERRNVQAYTEEYCEGVKDGFEEGFKASQALQSGSGVYSLEDIEKAIEWGINVEAGNISRDYSMGAGRQFIGSLSKSEPKEGIVIELNGGNLVFKH